MKFSSLFIVILGLILIGLIFSYSDFETSDSLAITKPKTEADYFFEKVSIKTFNKEGRNINQLDAQKLEHFKNKNQSLVNQPLIVMTSETGSKWSVSSTSGEMDHQSGSVSLMGQVNIIQQSEYNDSTEIVTSDLTVDINKNLLSTPEKVSIISSNIETTAEGLEANINMEQLELKGKVRSKGVSNEF